jgi:hypothetical protein
MEHYLCPMLIKRPDIVIALPPKQTRRCKAKPAPVLTGRIVDSRAKPPAPESLIPRLTARRLIGCGRRSGGGWRGSGAGNKLPHGCVYAAARW